MSLPCQRVQCDEVWGFCATKAKNAESVKDFTRERYPWRGDVWTWTALCPDSKLLFSWLCGERSAEHARIFIRDVKRRLANRVQITTDGLSHYVTAIEEEFGWGRCDYAQIVKQYGTYIENESGERRYSPSTCTGFEVFVVMGNPDPDHISTSFVERQNLTMRTHMRRLTRLTLAFSRRLENFRHATALHFAAYNFVKRNRSIGTTPAFAAGVTDHVWTMREIAELVERYDYTALVA